MATTSTCILNHLYFTHYQQGNNDLNNQNFIKPKVDNITLKPNPGKPGLGKPVWVISCQPCHPKVMISKIVELKSSMLQANFR